MNQLRPQVPASCPAPRRLVAPSCVRLPHAMEQWGASALQKGRAVELRTERRLDSSMRRDLNWIVHSSDPDPHKRGHNPFADPTKTYDRKAQKVIAAAKAELGRK